MSLSCLRLLPLNSAYALAWLDIYLNCVMSVIDRLRVILKYERLPRAGREFAPGEVHEQRLLRAR